MGPYVKISKLKSIITQQGVSLVEVMIALVVLLIVFIGLLQGAILSVDSNMRNILRDEAVTLAAATMENTRGEPFTNVGSDSIYSDAIPSGTDCPSVITTGSVIQINIRNMTRVLCVSPTCTELGGDGDCTTDDADTKQLNVTVGWRWKDRDYTHSVTTLRRR